jgi:hypothetical protein
MYAFFRHSVCYIWQFAIDQMSLEKKIPVKARFLHVDGEADRRMDPRIEPSLSAIFWECLQKYLRTKRSQGALLLLSQPVATTPAFIYETA